MRALTLTQPWAQLVADGRKRYETRGWRPSFQMLGQQIAIHAAKGWQSADRDCAEAFGYEPDELTRGAIVAVARLEAWGRTEDQVISDEEREYGDYTPGRWAWKLADLRKLERPVTCRGALGLWDVPDEIVALIIQGKPLPQALAGNDAMRVEPWE